MNPAVVVRLLRPAAIAVGVRVPVEVPEDTTPEDLLELLGELAERVEALHPSPRPRPVQAAGETHEVTKYRVPGDVEAQVVALARAGRRDPEIATELRMSVHTVRAIRRRANVPGAVGPVNRSGWEAKVEGLLARGMSRAEIAEAMGWTLGSTSTKLWLLRKRGQT